MLVLVDSFLSLQTSVWYVHTVQLARFKAQLAGVSKKRIKHLHYYVYIMEILCLETVLSQATQVYIIKGNFLSLSKTTKLLLLDSLLQEVCFSFAFDGSLT